VNECVRELPHDRAHGNVHGHAPSGHHRDDGDV